MNAEEVRRAIEKCFPSFVVRSISYLAEGWSSVAWEVHGSRGGGALLAPGATPPRQARDPNEGKDPTRESEPYVFRFPKRREVWPGLRREILLLPALSPTLPFRIPQFEYAWEGGPAYEGVFVGYARIPGVEMTGAHAREGGLAVLAEQLGRFLLALRSFPEKRAAALGVPAYGPDTWRGEYEALCQVVRRRVVPLLGHAAAQNLTASWNEFLGDAANFRFRPALIHRDLCGEHILCDPELKRISGIIDWEDACVGDPAFDYTGLLDYGPDFVREVLSAAEEGDAGRALAVARFYRRMASCHEVLFGLDAGLPCHVDAGLDELGRVWTSERLTESSNPHQA